jgi:predicted enzyme related to lactoylglutathione lyase
MPTASVLASAKIMAFVYTSDPAHGKAFYRDTLGMRLVEEELPYALVFDVQNIMLRVGIMPGLVPAKHTVLGWQVADIVATVKGLQEAGVKFERYPGMPQDELGIMQFPGGARVAWFQDPDGNVLSVTQL